MKMFQAEIISLLKTLTFLKTPRFTTGQINVYSRGGPRPFLGHLSPPKTIISYLNDQASDASLRKIIILARLSISVWYSRAVMDH